MKPTQFTLVGRHQKSSAKSVKQIRENPTIINPLVDFYDISICFG